MEVTMVDVGEEGAIEAGLNEGKKFLCGLRNSNRGGNAPGFLASIITCWTLQGGFVSGPPTIMNTLPAPVAATAQIPLLSGARSKLAQALKDGASYFELALLFEPTLVKYLRAQKTYALDLEDCCRYLEEAKRGAGDMFELFYTIPRKALESIVLGTVAYDVSNTVHGPGSEGMSYEIKGCGIYVVGISINGRNGEFLTGNELQELADNLDKYILGCRMGAGVHNGILERSRLTQDQQNAIDFAVEVDKTYGTWVHVVDRKWKPRYLLPNDRHNSRMSALLRSLQARAREAKRLDPTGQTRTIQSPLYVGCSSKMQERVEAYVPRTDIKSAFSKANTLYALTMSLLRRQGLHPVPKIISAVRTWKGSQLSRAEMLVAALANCYVTQDGFNINKAGQTAETSGVSTSTAKQMVFGLKKFMKENVSQSLTDVQACKTVHEQLESLRPVTTGMMYAEAEGLERKVRALCSDARDVVQQRARLQDECQKMGELQELINARIKQKKEEYALFKLLSTKAGIIPCSDEESS